MANPGQDPGQQAASRGDIPNISIPKGGGAVRDVGEKFEVNAANGSASLSIPVQMDGGRSGFKPQVILSYNAGIGNGPFGWGWSISQPEITRKTDKGLPRYDDEGESDVFILSGAEDLVRILEKDGDEWRPEWFNRVVEGVEYRIHRYRPRVEGLFARIERWMNRQTRDIHWRTISPDNVTTLYGRTPESRIADPDDHTRCFSWLICESYDDTGNALLYEYKAENSQGVDLRTPHEVNRTRAQRSAQRYLKRIRFGNRSPALDKTPPSDWMFEVVFDYGEHADEHPWPEEEREWLCRRDPFSSYRSAFEVRTYRLCRRILVFHNFPEEESVGNDCLVRSTVLSYRGDSDRGQPLGSFLASVSHRGYKRQPGGAYVSRAVPPIELEYTEARLHDRIQDVDLRSVENLPEGAGGNERWVDLDGEGLPGLLTEQGGSWFYKRNLGNARFAPVQLVSTAPSIAALERGMQQLMDVDSDGRIELVSLADGLSGYYERTDRGWAVFRVFESGPRINWNDPELKWIDLDGDGLSDVVISGDYAFTWYRSLGTEGFSAGHGVFKPTTDERQGPRLVFEDGEHSIFLADMSGDGLSDLVRIRNGEICYWPNLGYGQFGPKITMDGAPWFDTPDLFDQARIRLADIDGSGTTDIVYLGRDSAGIFFNEMGNGWSEPHRLLSIPETHELAEVSTVDLMGNGTACLVWSSSEPDAVSRPMRYVDLMGGVKPHLLSRIKNNMGAERQIHYASSTKFYREDQSAGDRWITRLPFPVQVVERVETYDRVSHNRFHTRYRYHHGFYDGIEREFRGFGMVEQYDTEHFAALSGGSFPAGANIDEKSSVPPVLTKTWFHVGDFWDRNRLTRRYEHEYWREPGLTPVEREAMELPDSRMPHSLNPEEEREACRALKNSVLRREVYAEDGSEKASRPYTAAEINYTILFLQPKGPNKHASFYVHTRETLDFNYERQLFPIGERLRPDPRVTHNIALKVDDYGNLLRSVTIAYGRRYADPALAPGDQASQRTIRATFTATDYTNAVLEPDNYRHPLAADTSTWELLNLRPASRLPHITNLFRFEEVRGNVRAASDDLHDLPYPDYKGAGISDDHPYRRLIEQTRVIYRRDDLTGPLPLGIVEPRALPFADYHRALTPQLVAEVFEGRVTDEMLTSGGYLHLEGEEDWWKPSGLIFYSPNLTDTPAEELEFARKHFFAQHRFEDPFGNVSTVLYDRYTLLVQQTRDALGNLVTAGERDAGGNLVGQGNDYRVLQPRLVMDPNRNRKEAAYDALGILVGTALRGKPGEEVGDTLEGFETDLPDDVLLRHLRNPLEDPASVLQGATMRMLYDLFAYVRTQHAGQPEPAVMYTMARITHVSDLKPGEQTRIVHTFSYTDGFNREIQKKLQAEPGPLEPNGPVVQPRWTATGWTIFDNKGNPVQQYEPFFSADHSFEFGIKVGVSSVLFYDPASRVVARLHPNHSFEKVVFDSWKQTNWDVNDTVLIENPADDPDCGDFFRRLPVSEYLPTWYTQRIGGAMGAVERNAAEKTAIHAATPANAYFDAMGRIFLAVAHNRFRRHETVTDERYATRLEIDIEGNERGVTDAKHRLVIRNDFDMLGVKLHFLNMESGARWVLGDITGKSIFNWDNRENVVRTTYDELRRVSLIFLTAGRAPEFLVNRTVYGEAAADAESRNLRGRVYQTLDNAGLATAELYNFKGNAIRSRRQLLRDFKTQPDWNVAPALEDEWFEQSTVFDAVDRPIQLIAPHGSSPGTSLNVIQPSYNEANLLERIDVWPGLDSAPAGMLDRDSAELHAVTNIDYNAKGQRTRIDYGNGSHSEYEYDPLMFRLQRIHTARTRSGDPELQDLRYVYDPAANVTSMRDRSQPTVWFRNQRIDPDTSYTYDATYRLIEATGREHLGQIAPGVQPRGPDDVPLSPLPRAGDNQAFARYREEYLYDEVSNILELFHRPLDPTNGGFRRSYEYNEASLLEPGKMSNRLSVTRIGDAVERYSYDAAGNTTSMPHVTAIEWDYRDQIQATSRQSVHEGEPETTYYVYDSKGRRVRKVTARASTSHSGGARRKERLYLDGFEIYREYDPDGDSVRLERQELHIFDVDRRVALIETRTVGEDHGPARLARFQYDNHLGSTVLELDEQARIISYEEFYPYGATSYRLAEGETPKRYRYNGKERDEENGLYYYGARYYAAWLSRWMSCDPHFREESSNSYTYARLNPITFSDRSGNEESSGWNRFMGGLRMVGGALQVVGGAAVFVQVEVPVAAQVVGGVAVVHGLDDVQAGFRELVSGKNVDTFTKQSATGVAKWAGAEDKTAEKIGTGVDIAAGFVSPAPITGAGEGGAKVLVNTPRFVTLQNAATGAKELHVITETTEVSTKTLQATATAAGTLQGTGTVLSTGGGGGGGSSPQKDDQPKEEPKNQKPQEQGEALKEKPKISEKDLKTVKTHPSTGGNRQVEVNGQRWNLPKGVDPSKIPAVDKVGDQLQAAAKTAASQWNATKLTAAERQAIAQARAEGKYWLANLLEKQAKGRYVESQIRPQFPNLQWSRQGVDAIDPATGIEYDILSGTQWNMAQHAKRMADLLFRMITF
jgi:RHS repeat-associated protein